MPWLELSRPMLFIVINGGEETASYWLGGDEC